MKLKQLFKGIEDVEIRGSKEVELTGLSSDSRIVAPSHLFIAKKGHALDGAEFIPHALEAGAAAIVTDLYNPFVKQPQAITRDPGRLEPLLASRFYQNPSLELCVLGVTGTKGKTTTTYLIYYLLQELGRACGLCNTVETCIAAEKRSSTLTTHSAIQNQKWMRELVVKGCDTAIFEISSHGLAQNRTSNIAFDMAVFTNLSSDHLDYHKNMDEYAKEKRKLFEQLDESSKKNKRAFFNGDDPWSDFIRGKEKAWTFGCNNSSVDIYASQIKMDQGKLRFYVQFEGQNQEFFLPLMGRFNVYNALGAIGVGLHAGASLTKIAEALATFPGAPGRLEAIENDRGLSIYVDYAHTGEALENVLKTLKEFARQRILCVFGAGGARDPQRRTNMAKAAEQYADLSIITSDNPRSEDPTAICQEILAGFANPKNALVELDRKKAIFLGVQLAKPGDILLIAGKGHEKVQIFAHQTIAFDDCVIVKEALQL